MEGDSEWNYAYYALHKLHIMPWEFAELDIRKKAALIALIDIRIEKEKKEEAKLRSLSKRRR